jgi:histidinol-phosphate/aromatic aminotransferase/cobyric acid decarboxylase-like protein
LRDAIGRYAGVPADRIVAGAGLDNVLETLMLLLIEHGDRVIVSEPTFMVYQLLVRGHGGQTVNVPLDRDFQLDAQGILDAVDDRTKLIVICNPNNPTGNLLAPEAIERIAANAPCLVSIDEAYAEFAGASYRDLMDEYPNLAVLRTLSKFAGLAGMRVGYGIFPESLMPYLMRVMPGFCNVSAAASATAIAALADEDYNRAIIDRIVADRATAGADSEIDPRDPDRCDCGSRRRARDSQDGRAVSRPHVGRARSTWNARYRGELRRRRRDGSSPYGRRRRHRAWSSCPRVTRRAARYCPLWLRLCSIG